ncbi:hypothetical protein DFH11DRAFT_1748495 [Phellopilus nigrolimitatus]|nr:hypothetical protein DFH11DRAFT_1748495 [Phellopilus nigrolimitatus]
MAPQGSIGDTALPASAARKADEGARSDPGGETLAVPLPSGGRAFLNRLPFLSLLATPPRPSRASSAPHASRRAPRVRRRARRTGTRTHPVVLLSSGRKSKADRAPCIARAENLSVLPARVPTLASRPHGESWHSTIASSSGSTAAVQEPRKSAPAPAHGLPAGMISCIGVQSAAQRKTLEKAPRPTYVRCTTRRDPRKQNWNARSAASEDARGSDMHRVLMRKTEAPPTAGVRGGGGCMRVSAYCPAPSDSFIFRFHNNSRPSLASQRLLSSGGTKSCAPLADAALSVSIRLASHSVPKTCACAPLRRSSTDAHSAAPEMRSARRHLAARPASATPKADIAHRKRRVAESLGGCGV